MKMITEYLQNDPVSYDFSDDCTENAAYQEKKGYEKYFIYRSPQPDGKEIYPIAASVIEKNYQLYGKVGDPDVKSSLLQSIYSLLWPEIREEKSGYMMYQGWICSDTMTSCQSVLNSYVKSRMPEVLERYDAKNVSSLMCIELYEADAAFKKLLEESEDLEHFIAVYHTLGNYLPVPCGFNKARSGYYGSHDSWDLTLMKIKEYYDARKETSSHSGELSACPPEIKLMELLHCNREIISCYQWLNGFAGWEDFIAKNFLQDFVGKDYQPIPFCKDHSWKCPQISDDNFDEFFRNAWQMIEKRSRRMIEEIETKNFYMAETVNV